MGVPRVPRLARFAGILLEHPNPEDATQDGGRDQAVEDAQQERVLDQFGIWCSVTNAITTNGIDPNRVSQAVKDSRSTWTL